ncbi:MAG TPA: transposase, partial [bacterium]|nr:transposase [bacterium]
ATGYNRCYGGWLLRNWGRKVVVYNKGKRTVLIGERKERQKGIRRRTIYYDKEVLDVLKHIWLVLDCPCGKRLAPYLREVVRVLEREGK